MEPFATVNPPFRSANGVFVYILACPDGAFDVGTARDFSRRIKLHRAGGGAKFTRDHSAPAIVYWEGPSDLKAAVRREFQIKRWSRAKKEALIRGDTFRLRMLSLSRESSGRA